MRKRIKIWIYSLVIMGVFSLLTSSCGKNDTIVNPPPTALTVSDIDGNLYHTVTIGTQIWIVENLKTTRYNDSTPIPLVTDSAAWNSLTTPGYCWYNNDTANKNTYGAIYNWFTVNTGKLAPTGWHVPSDDEWTTLTTYLGGESIAGGKLKETGTTHWRTPNLGATNENGFTALPGGHRDVNGSFNVIGDDGFWWSVTEYGTTGKAWYRSMDYNYVGVLRVSNNKTNGHSVRCVKN
jgi:uncharacterized protein (TIGR02145 family)